MKKAILLAGIIAVVSCTATKTIAPTQADVDAAQVSFPGATMADLTKGKALYEENCGLCHTLHAPAAFAVEAWHSIVPGMVQQVNQNQMKIDANGERLILMYVTTMRK
jgi:cytochrome c5